MPEKNGRLSVINPATGMTVEEVPVSSREEVGTAVENARRGQKEWRGVSGLERAELFHEISRTLRDHASELAEIMTRECGKPFI